MKKAPNNFDQEPSLHPNLDRALSRIEARSDAMDEFYANPEAHWTKIQTSTERAGYSIKSRNDEHRWGLSEEWFAAENTIVYEEKIGKLTSDEAESKLSLVQDTINGFNNLKTGYGYKEVMHKLGIISGKIKPKQPKNQTRLNNLAQMYVDNGNARTRERENAKKRQEKEDLLLQKMHTLFSSELERRKSQEDSENSEKSE